MNKPARNKHTMKKNYCSSDSMSRQKHRHCPRRRRGRRGAHFRHHPQRSARAAVGDELVESEKVFAKLRKASIDAAQSLRHPGVELRVCYEAGLTGFVLARLHRAGELTAAAHHSLKKFVCAGYRRVFQPTKNRASLAGMTRKPATFTGAVNLPAAK